MLVDGRSVPYGMVVPSDLCVIGAGPAGISIALQYSNRAKLDVVLVESGGLEWDEETQHLSKGDSRGQAYYPLHETHLRVLGGTSLAYGGFSTEFTQLDFEKRPWVPESGWPLCKKDLDRYRDRAYELLGVQDWSANPVDAENPGGTTWKRVLAPPRPVRFGQAYRALLSSSDNVTTFVNSTATNLALHPDGRHIDHVAIKCLGGNEFRVSAKAYVLAAGGIENPRLLLASDDVATGGIGNANDNVGRYFQEHPRVFDRYRLSTRHDARRDVFTGVAGTLTFSRLGLGERIQRVEELLDYHANLSFGYVSQDTPQWNSVRRVAVAMRSPWKDMPYYNSMGGGRNKVRARDIGTALFAPHRSLLSLLQLKCLLPQSMRRWVEVASSVEQVPHRDNRVSLVRDRDVLGMRRVELQWSLHDLEKRTYERGLRLVLDEIDQFFPGISANRMDAGDPWPARVIGTWHHAGTTRMHADRGRGVVDSDCRVHGLDNLFVAGSSVFPTSASTAPTLTILCLALRLSEHLAQFLA